MASSDSEVYVPPANRPARGRRPWTFSSPEAVRAPTPSWTSADPIPRPGPVLFAYDGSGRARLAIEEAGRLLAPGGDALIVTVWTTCNVGFVPPADFRLNAAAADQVRKAAQETAADGAALAEAAGFHARSLAVQAAPSWKAIVEIADGRDASLIVLASYRRRALADVLFGTVTRAVEVRAGRPVLIVCPPTGRGCRRANWRHRLRRASAP